ncbi:hypothetical protein M409DRAFT_23001 [Zasmidium cellare ATCC 36951]|uniref:Alpha/beta hydrolase fold-3 domain-containing protein n=1 Tax=Zasmidium cellare ATCC 36951 TaxID=1080233 RepID=A0A6A6CIB0_ZASCE|nr:uncharacterized protein M409DRAFT_23001 [Zasmidium cellare ATCC 36951]KAF2166954.1 hypothetical protein M409DRAFT_23001 [Zasmidium cellare ATCC 36951]
MEKQEFTYKTVTYDDTTTTILKANVYYTPAHKNESPEARPIALYFHGGGFIVGSKDDISPLHLDLLLSHGFVIVAPNYRLCPTILATEGPVQDSLDCYEWARRDLPQLLQAEGVALDAERLVALGTSCGGTIAHHMKKSPHPPREILDIAGQKFLGDPWFTSGLLPPGYTSLPSLSPSFIEKVHSEFPPPTSFPVPWGPEGISFDRPRFAWMFSSSVKGTTFKEITGGDTDTLDPVAIFNDIGDGKCPATSFLHGGEDSLVNMKFARRAWEILRRKGVECDLILVEGRDHGFDEDVKEGEEGYEEVAKAFDFLIRHVEV